MADQAARGRGKRAGTRVEFVSEGPDHIEARVNRADENEDLLTLNVRSLNIGRDDVDGISAQGAQASIVTVIALTWAT